MPNDRYLHRPLWVRVLDEAMARVRPRSVLDLGCGPRTEKPEPPYAHEILSRLPANGQYVGVDRDPLAIATHRKLTNGDPRVSYWQGEFDALPTMPDRYRYDLVVTKCFVCAWFYQDQFPVIERIRELGRWWLLYDSFRLPGFDPLDAYLKSLGRLHMWHRQCEDNPEYTRCGLIEFPP